MSNYEDQAYFIGRMRETGNKYGSYYQQLVEQAEKTHADMLPDQAIEKAVALYVEHLKPEKTSTAAIIYRDIAAALAYDFLVQKGKDADLRRSVNRLYGPKATDLTLNDPDHTMRIIQSLSGVINDNNVNGSGLIGKVGKRDQRDAGRNAPISDLQVAENLVNAVDAYVSKVPGAKRTSRSATAER
jgi:hypothetical protein